MTDTEQARVARNHLLGLIGKYWDIAYAEGKEGREHDTEDGAAQQCLHDIDIALASLDAALQSKPVEAATLHQQIINLPCSVDNSRPVTSSHEQGWRDGYAIGHRDARHAAVQLVLASAPVEAAQTSAHRFLTHDEVMALIDIAPTPGGDNTFDAIQRKFCEVNNIRLASAPPAAATVPDLNVCLPDGVMSDAFGNPRVRYVRVICDGQTCVVTPEDASQYVNDPEGHEAYYYTFKDVYLSKEEFDGLPEFDGF